MADDLKNDSSQPFNPSVQPEQPGGKDPKKNPARPSEDDETQDDLRSAS